jgi:hypothetical protein
MYCWSPPGPEPTGIDGVAPKTNVHKTAASLVFCHRKTNGKFLGSVKVETLVSFVIGPDGKTGYRNINHE